jgi:uncharacterized protein with HEPN domain
LSIARDLSACLHDITEGCNAIEGVMEEFTLDEYRKKRVIRSSVEREFIIIGEALRRISVLANRLFMSISNSRLIVDFRNLFTHNYGAVSDDAVYGLIYSDLIVLKAEVAELLSDPFDAS